jgi:hypothetical protein
MSIVLMKKVEKVQIRAIWLPIFYSSSSLTCIIHAFNSGQMVESRR